MSLVRRRHDAPAQACRMGIGFEEPGSSEVFADATPQQGRALHVTDVPYGALEASMQLQRCLTLGDQQTLRTALSGLGICKQPRHIEANPAAGTIRARELAGPWMVQTLRQLDIDNEKNAKLLFEKRYTGMAKQGVAALAAIGVTYEMTNLSSQLRDAMKFRELSRERQQRMARRRREEALKGGQVLDACQAFDGRRVAGLLGLKVPRDKSFGLGIAP